MAELTVHDIVQQYQGTVVFYKGKPHKVKQVGAEIKLLDLITQRNKLVEFKLKDFSAPFTRLGYVNIDEAAVYIARRPARIMKVGIDSSNCMYQVSDGAPCPNDLNTITRKVLEMESHEFGLMLLGHYPSLENARKRAGTFEGCVAFDKQFAIDAYDRIYYKGRRVGEWEKGHGISFDRGEDHLDILLGGKHEKMARVFRKA